MSSNFDKSGIKLKVLFRSIDRYQNQFDPPSQRRENGENKKSEKSKNRFLWGMNFQDSDQNRGAPIPVKVVSN